MPVPSYSDPSRTSSATLLIADDDPVVRSTLSIALDPHFDIVAVAADAGEAVACAADTAPAAALIDVDMPGGGGLHAVHGIAEVSPETAIVVLSGDESDGVVVELLQAGAMSYCRKGLEPHELAETIERSIVAHRQLHARRAGNSA